MIFVDNFTKTIKNLMGFWLEIISEVNDGKVENPYS